MMDFNSISSITFWLGTILPLVLILVSVILVIAGLFDYRKTRRLRRLPTVPGTVIKSEISRVDDGYFEPEIRYRFEIGGRIYESDKFFHGQNAVSYGSETAQKKIAPYPVGENVQIHYNPENPEESVVEIKSLIKFYFVGALAITIGAIIWAINFWVIELLPVS